jgi:glycosyltransferase involved in cell wall biosynthesis
MNITAIILTSNEEKHLARCIDSIKAITSDILVVDSYSTDSTADIAELKGATFITRKWVNYATQFNWALTQLKSQTNWVLRLDADEIITGDLAKEIIERISTVEDDVNGIYVCRRMIFQSQLIKYGGLFPLKVIRLMRYGYGECENRWMDEHIKVKGRTIEFNGEIIDNNLNSLTWWTDKHNKYSSREAIDLLNLEFNFMKHDTVASLELFREVETTLPGFTKLVFGRGLWLKPTFEL